MTRRLLVPLLFLVGSALFLVGGWLIVRPMLQADEAEFARPGEVPIGGPFTLTAHTGERVTAEDLKGKFALMFFGFTNCPDVCPTTLADVAETMDLLGDEAEAVQPVFVTLDPERDTPEALRSYVNAFDPRILGLTGTTEEIKKMADTFRIAYGKEAEDANGNYSISHQANTYLMSPEGNFMIHFSFGTPPETMAKVIRQAIDAHGTQS
jgi:protein SCO1/2